MKYFIRISTIALLITNLSCKEKEITVPDNYIFSETPVWQDEFDYTGKPISEKWSFDLGGSGWGNNELQNYTNNPENVRVENGLLTIEARKEVSGNRQYSSTRLVTRDKASFKYGKFEVRAKLPSGRGTWPAIWALANQNTYGDKFWPDNGGFDLVAHVGFDQNRVYSNIHSKAFPVKGNSKIIKSASSDFHVYSCEWTPDRITMWVDGKPTFNFPKEASYGWQEWPFDQPFYLILNIAIGGNWGGEKGIDDSIFPQKLVVDYVRVYELIGKK
ncbi:glycoside hydrolase family 16 protein [Telluribacter sp.]|jgi:beta-glucanase (GH16 family)|uniref:glycoside hydrolase family 16 protein n=1 Tax=Telluribacter sp. TaxID=1978767 RepID=UPI002E15335C|nr:glycoside hydrolase family 16 protein [Telluribacter sp.]